MISQLRRGILLVGAIISASMASFAQEEPVLVVPDGGEQFTEGDIVPIVWTGFAPTEQVTLEYSVNGGISWQPISNTATKGKYLWSVPSLSGAACLVRVSKFVNASRAVYSIPFSGSLPNGSVFTPDGSRIVAITQAGDVYVLAASDGALIKQFHAHDGSIIRVDISDDGSRIATASIDGTVKIWSTADWSLSRTLASSPPVGSFHARFSPDGTEVVAGYNDGRIRVWNVATGATRLDFIAFSSGFARGIDYSRDGKLLLAAGSDGVGRVFSATDGHALFTLTGHTDQINSIRSSPDGSLIATGCFDGTARLWDAKTGVHIRTFSGHTGDVYSVKFDPSGTRVVTSSADKTVRVWRVSDGVQIALLQGHSQGVVRAIFSPDGTRISSVASDGTMKLWELAGIRSDQSSEPFSIVTCSLSAVGQDATGRTGKRANHIDLR